MSKFIQLLIFPSQIHMDSHDFSYILIFEITLLFQDSEFLNNSWFIESKMELPL